MKKKEKLKRKISLSSKGQVQFPLKLNKGSIGSFDFGQTGNNGLTNRPNYTDEGGTYTCAPLSDTGCGTGVLCGETLWDGNTCQVCALTYLEENCVLEIWAD